MDKATYLVSIATIVYKISYNSRTRICLFAQKSSHNAYISVFEMSKDVLFPNEDCIRIPIGLENDDEVWIRRIQKKRKYKKQKSSHLNSLIIVVFLYEDLIEGKNKYRIFDKGKEYMNK